MKRLADKTDGLLNFIDYKKKRYVVLYWLMFALLVFVGAICLVPALWVLTSAFKDPKEFLAIPPTIIPHSFQPYKIVEVWNKLNFSRYYLNSLTLVAGELVFCIVCNGLAGYVLSRLKPKGAVLVGTLIFWSMLLPSSLNMMVLYSEFVKLPLLGVNITNTYLPMWLMHGANAFYVLLFKSFFDSISITYVEAARIDGCTNLGIFRRIILPLSKPIVMAVSIFAVNAGWGEYFWPYVIIKEPSALPIAVKVAGLKGSDTVDIYMMGLLLTIIPPTIIFIFFSKQIMGGLQLGGIKG